MPRRRRWRPFEASPTLEFEFILAEKLGRTVAELRAGLGNDEFVQWGIFFARRNQREELERLKAGG